MACRAPDQTPDRADVEAWSSRPRSPHVYAELLDEVVHRLAAKRAEPRSALGVASSVVRETTWSGFRTGRARLASAAAAYLTWMTPPISWEYEALELVDGRRPLGWRSPDGGLLCDLLCADRIGVRSLVPTVFSTHGRVAAVRVLDVGAPTRSVAYERPGTARPLTDSAWWFGGEAR